MNTNDTMAIIKLINTKQTHLGQHETREITRRIRLLETTIDYYFSL